MANHQQISKFLKFKDNCEGHCLLFQEHGSPHCGVLRYRSSKLANQIAGFQLTMLNLDRLCVFVSNILKSSCLKPFLESYPAALSYLWYSLPTFHLVEYWKLF